MRRLSAPTDSRSAAVLAAVAADCFLLISGLYSIFQIGRHGVVIVVVVLVIIVVAASGSIAVQPASLMCAEQRVQHSTCQNGIEMLRRAQKNLSWLCRALN